MMKRFPLSLNGHSLTYRLAVCSAGSSLLLVAMLAFINTRFIQAQYMQMEDERLNTIMRDALSTLGINLSYEFHKAIKETGNELLSNSGIVSVRIQNFYTGKKYLFNRPNYTHSDIDDYLIRSLPVPDPATGQKIGRLTVVYSKERYKRMMLLYWRNLAITVLLYIVGITLLIRSLLKRLKPLRRLAQQMQSFSPEKGTIDLDFGQEGTDEISRIAIAANAMIQNINDYSQRLKRLNAQLMRSHEELEKRVQERTKELKEKQAQLAHAGRLVSLGELAAGIAHEIGQPLQIIRSAAEIISDEIRDETFSKEEILPIADKICVQVDRAISIINTMRTFARHDNTAAIRPIDIRRPLADCLIFFDSQFRQHGIALRLNIPAKLPKVCTDPQKFQQIVVNLISNARHAVERRAAITSDESYKREISISLYPDETDQYVILEVRDNGTGMSAEVKERCIEPFFTTKEPDQGTGLGLSIIYGIITEFGFDMEISSVPGRGSTFRIRMGAYHDEN